MKKGYRIAPEIKDQILKRVREDGAPIAQIAQEHGISDRTIYGWLTKGMSGTPSLGELVRVKRQNEELLSLVGELTLKASQSQKKN